MRNIQPTGVQSMLGGFNECEGCSCGWNTANKREGEDMTVRQGVE